MLSIEELEKKHPETYPRNDIGTSNLFSNIFLEKLVYVTERKAFFVYDGKVWKKDQEDLMTHELAKEFAVSITEYFREKKPDDDTVLQYYSRYLHRDKRCKLINDTKSIRAVSVNLFDKQCYLINCLNGTVNIATREFHPHDPLDYLTKMSNVWYDPDAKSEDFEKFIHTVMLGKEDNIEYLQKALGYSITSATFQECFFITYGKSTRNGKGTLNSTMMHLLGDYAKTAPYSVFESKKFKNAGGANENVARLAGSRYVSVNEPEEGMVLDSAMIKTLSGNDLIIARFLYENSFEFMASFKIWINTNHLPVITDDSIFKSGRVQLIPFEKHFSEEEQDKGLKARLRKKENISGIFNWCLDGFTKMSKEGCLKIPKEIEDAISTYREINNRIGEFLNECFEMEADITKNVPNRIPLTKVYKIYTNWCKYCNYKPLNSKSFREKLKENASVRDISGQYRLEGYYIGKQIPEEWLA